MEWKFRQSDFDRKREHEKLQMGNGYPHDEHQRRFTPWATVGSRRRYSGLECNHVNERELGSYVGGGLRFPKRMEERFDAIRTTNLMAKAESRSTIILRVRLYMLEIRYIIMAGRNMA